MQTTDCVEAFLLFLFFSFVSLFVLPWFSFVLFSWAEVSLLLRKPIKTEEDMLFTVAAAEAGIIFTDQVYTLSHTILEMCSDILRHNRAVLLNRTTNN